MERGKERHLFPGNNTSVGFYSYYRYIMPQQEANHIFCLKGGPGVGKSTFMKKLGNRMQERGLKAEYLHCSSDPGSLDGVVFPEIGIALIDGTAPHVIDPINPGAVDEIINLGEYWDLEGIKGHKKEIIRTNSEVGRLFKRAFTYTAAAKNLLDDIIEIVSTVFNSAGPEKEAELIIKEEIMRVPICLTVGKIKKQFASAITPSGIVHYIDSLFDDTYKVYCIQNHWGVGVNTLLQRIAEGAVARNLYVELYYCPMNPEGKIDHIVIPEQKLAFVSENPYITLYSEKFRKINLIQYTDQTRLEEYFAPLEFNKMAFDMLLNQAVQTLYEAKTMHDEMEKYYIPHMDFEKENKKLEEVVQRILHSAEQLRI